MIGHPRKNRSLRYVALLRGINVGGKTLIKMAELKACVEELGLEQVTTYIASGNVLFDSDEEDLAKLETKLERAIEKRFELPVKVVVLDRREYARIAKAIPKAWVGDTSMRANVAFVRRGTDARQVVRGLQLGGVDRLSQCLDLLRIKAGATVTQRPASPNLSAGVRSRS